MNKVLFNNELEITASEIKDLVSLADSNLRNILKTLFVEFGVAVTRNQIGDISDNGLVFQLSPGIISIKAMVGVTENLDFVEVLDGEVSQAVPSDSQIYKVVLRHISTNYEKGTVTLLNGQSDVAGTGTDFTHLKEERMLDVEVRPGHIIEIDGVNFTIDEITDETNLTVVETAAQNFVDKQFKIKGNYFSAQPNEYLFEYDSYQIVLSTSESTLSADEILLANVSYDGNVMAITDKREENILTFRNETVIDDLPIVTTAQIAKMAIGKNLIRNSDFMFSDDINPYSISHLITVNEVISINTDLGAGNGNCLIFNLLRATKAIAITATTPNTVFQRSSGTWITNALVGLTAVFYDSADNYIDSRVITANDEDEITVASISNAAKVIINHFISQSCFFDDVQKDHKESAGDGVFWMLFKPVTACKFRLSFTFYDEDSINVGEAEYDYEYSADTAWVKLEQALSIPGGTKYIYFVVVPLDVENDTGQNFYIDRMKMELGENATEWTRHPDDLIEIREVNRAAWLINRLFEIYDSGGGALKVKLKANLYDVAESLLVDTGQEIQSGTYVRYTQLTPP